MNDKDRLYQRIHMAQDGDSEQCGKIVEENSALIWSIVKRFFGRGTEADDLFQIGCIGMMKAVYLYDFEYGTMFSTYAVPKIAGEIRRFLRDDGIIKTSRNVKEAGFIIAKAREDILRKTGTEARLSEISEYTGLSLEQIALCESASAEVLSLSAKNEQTGSSLEDTLPDGHTEDEIIEKVFLNQTVKKLSADEQKVIRLRFYKGQTQQQTARILKISQVKVSRTERRAIKKLRELYAER